MNIRHMGVLAVFVVMMSFMPMTASAALVGFSKDNPIVPAVCNCPESAAGWGCLLGVIDNLVSFAVSISVIIATLVFAYAGFLWVMSPTNPENRQKGRKIMMDAVIGFLIVLGAWLLVNSVLAVLTNYTVDTATSVLTGGDQCLQSSITGLTPPPDKLLLGTGTTSGGGQFIYQNTTIAKQAGDISVPLNALLTCIYSKVPAGVGQISSVSDSVITDGSHTFAQCRAGGTSAGCAHEAGSCHYGGNGSKGDTSFAIDFGDEQNAHSLDTAAKACNSQVFSNWEGNHLHLSVGNLNGAGCDVGTGKPII